MSTVAIPPGQPYTIACGNVAGATGAGTALFGIAAGSIARTGKGVYTITLGDKPATSSFFPLYSANSGDCVAFTAGYSAVTGILTVNTLDLAGAAQDRDFAFEVRVIPGS